ncbi:prolyl-tRNA editing protein [Plakobranchus ocellatus]|uniref:PrdX deacylase domain-containing protein 1 n=1 Tax=Plakobranchus ocellatus TaxID=259542 RepID=A0AAV4CM84_9GAST|nr:prolyl-tRNA editing protein [Plakobranchus ocellatus]
MASKRPRYGGVQNTMETLQQPGTAADVADCVQSSSELDARFLSQIGGYESVRKDDSYLENSSKSVSTSSTGHENASQRNKEDHLEQLMQVFEALDIKAKPKPYYADVNHKACVESLRNLNDILPARADTAETQVISCKNLFLKDRRGQFYIVICENHDSVDLKILKQQLKAHRNLSFGDSTALQEILQLESGEITPLAVMHDSAKNVRIAVYSKLIKTEVDQPAVNFAFHPLCGHLQVDLSYLELVKFLEHFNKVVEVISDESLNLVKISQSGNSPHPETNRHLSNSPGSEMKKQSTVQECGPGINQPDSPLQTLRDCFTTAGLDSHMTVTNNLISSIESINTTYHELSEAEIVAHIIQLKPNNCLGQDKETNYTSSFADRCGYSQTNESSQGTTVQPEKISNTQVMAEDLGFFPSEVVKERHTTPRKTTFLSRKGKLRSYIKKQNQFDTNEDSNTSKSCLIYLQDNGGGKKSIPGNSSFPPHKELNQTVQHDHDVSSLNTTQSELQDLVSVVTSAKSQAISVQTLEQRQKNSSCKVQHKQGKKYTPDTEQFYSSLSNSGAKFTEIDLSSDGDGKVIRPSVGCRCFLLQDKSDNYFFIISHELYEPDFGRLKAALRPRKKLMIAHPADIVLVLGADPSRLSPFAVLTLRNQNSQVFITRKIVSPNLVLCIQHPFKPAYRIIMESSEMQKYLQFQGVTFGVVEEKHWPSRFNFPFSQFENMGQKGKELYGLGTESRVLVTDDEFIAAPASILGQSGSESSNNAVIVSSYQLKKNSLSYLKLRNLFHNLRSLSDVKDALYNYMLARHVFPFYTETPHNDEGSSVDGTIHNTNTHINSLQTPNMNESMRDQILHSHKIKTSTNNHEKQSPHMQVKESQIQHLQIVLKTTDDLIKHLSAMGVSFTLKRRQKHMVADHYKEPDDMEDNNIIEHCSIMHLTNKAGHNFLIVGAHDDFPMSVKRFCRRCRIREHLDIRADPQEEREMDFLSEIALGMMPFCFADGDLRALLWSRLRPEGKTCRKSIDSFIAEQPGVTVVLTTTLYIDPATHMEFAVGAEGSKLRMTSSEFVKYSQAVGFEVLYY